MARTGEICFACSSVVILHILVVVFVFFNYLFTNRHDKLDVALWLEEIPSDYFKALGIILCISLSVLGAAVGIFAVGSSMMGMGTKRIHVKTKNLISIIFAEAGAIYGLVMGIVMISKFDEISFDESKKLQNFVSGYVLFGAGLSTGLVNLFSGVALGVVGSGVALADGANPQTFVKNILLEIFAGAISLFGLITGIYMVSKAAG